MPSFTILYAIMMLQRKLGIIEKKHPIFEDHMIASIKVGYKIPT